jgi:predicted Fe-Mo cluster-binding NifX family protein
MKLAAVFDDGLTISTHFGRAPFYRVFTFQARQIGTDEMRQKPHHGQSDYSGNICSFIESPRQQHPTYS